MFTLEQIDDIAKLRLRKRDILTAVKKALPLTEQDDGKLWDLIEQGDLRVWVGKNEDTVVGLVTTTVINDLMGNKSILIYTVTGAQVEDAYWTKGLAVLSAYAKKKGASQIVTFMNKPKLAGLVEAAGGQVLYYGIIPCQ